MGQAWRKPPVLPTSFKPLYCIVLYQCTQLTSAVFSHLKGVKRLNIGGCPSLLLTDRSLAGIEWLNMYAHPLSSFTKIRALGYTPSKRDVMGVGEEFW